jgi:hypothetical protein
MACFLFKIFKKKGTKILNLRSVNKKKVYEDRFWVWAGYTENC